MGPIPEDLIVFLLFGMFVLIQILRARRRKQARRGSASPDAPAEPEAEPVIATPTPLPWTPEVFEGPRPKPPARARQSLSATPSGARRFSRRELLGDRRSLQDAIVAATILGPCLAQRPRDME